MQFLRLHWFDIGVGLAFVVGAYVAVTRPTGVCLLLWLSLITLFVHQFEEYRYPGYFPGMLNAVLFVSQRPDRYPLNTQSALLVNAVIGWGSYVLAALLNTQAIWLGIATLLVSVGNVVAHVALFNIKGKTRYNPGMLTSLVLFLPLAVYFFAYVVRFGVASPVDWVLGIALGAVLNFAGIVGTIDWLKDAHTHYIFPARMVGPRATGATGATGIGRQA